MTIVAVAYYQPKGGRGEIVGVAVDRRIEDAEASPTRLAGWSLSSELPGFHKVVELKRRMGESKPVGQVVYSDGLAAVSVFIEPLQPQDPPRQRLPTEHLVAQPPQ